MGANPGSLAAQRFEAIHVADGRGSENTTKRRGAWISLHVLKLIDGEGGWAALANQLSSCTRGNYGVGDWETSSCKLAAVESYCDLVRTVLSAGFANFIDVTSIATTADVIGVETGDLRNGRDQHAVTVSVDVG